MSGEFAGTLKERVTIEAASGLRDAAGARTGDPVAGTPLWASVEAERPAIGADAERMTARARYTIKLRAEAAPGVGDSLLWREQSLVVLAVTRDPLRPDRVVLQAEARP